MTGRTYAENRPYVLPRTLGELTGPVTGVIQLPLRLEDLVRLAEEHDPGFDPAWFAEALSAVDRLPDTLFASYGLDPQDVSALKAQMHAWAEKISRD